MTTTELDQPAWTHGLMAALGRQPVPFAEVVRRVQESEPKVTSDAVASELSYRGDVLFRDGDVVSLLAAAEGAILTHIVTEQELSLGVLAADGDLDLWARLADEELPLTSGGTVHTRWGIARQPLPDGTGAALAGPAGWLDGLEPGSLVGLRLVGGALSLDQDPQVPEIVGEALDRVMAFSEHAVDAARKALEDYAADEPDSTPGAMLDDVLAHLVTDRPDVFERPLPPVSQLVYDEGLERLGAFVGLPGLPLGSEADYLEARELWALAQGHSALFSLREYPERTELAKAVLLTMGIVIAAERLADTIELRPLPPLAVSTLLEVAADDTERAHAVFLASRDAEGRREFVEAERLVTEAARLVPDCWPVARDAAMFAAARANAVEATRLLRAAGADGDDPLLHSMRRLTDLPAGAVSRNRPCPCGSGRKYKACCLRHETHALPDRAELVFARLIMHSRRPHLLPTMARLVTAITPESQALALDLAIFDGGVTEDYLQRRGHLLRDDERDLLRAWSSTPLQPYEVTNVQPYRTVTLRPLLGGAPVVLRDGQFSSCGVAPLDVLLARPLSNGERPILLSLPVLVHRMRRSALLDLFRDGTYDQHEVVRFFGPQPPPKLRNRDGEDLVLCEAVYSVPHDDGWQRLAEVLGPDEDDDDLLVLVGREVADEEYLNRGTVQRQAGSWTLTTNSVERMAELKGLVLDAAAGAALVSESAQSAEEAMAQSPAPADEPFEPFSVDEELGLSPAEQAALLDEYMQSHERRWVDEQVPALGGLSARQAVSAGGGARAELEALLDDMAWMHRQSGGGMDAHRVRALLGLSSRQL